MTNVSPSQRAALEHASKKRVLTPQFVEVSTALESLIRSSATRIAILGKRSSGRNYLVRSTLRKVENEFLCATGALTPTRTKRGNQVANQIFFDLLNSLGVPIALKDRTRDPAERWARYLMIRCAEANRTRVVFSLRGFELVPPVALLTLEHMRSLAADRKLEVKFVLQTDASTLKAAMTSLYAMGGKALASDYRFRHREYKLFPLSDMEGLFASFDKMIMPTSDGSNQKKPVLREILPRWRGAPWSLQSCSDVCVELILATARSSDASVPSRLPLPMALQIIYSALEAMAKKGDIPTPAETRFCFSSAIDLCGLNEYLQGS